MVYYSSVAEDDLVEILHGLAIREENPLDFKHAMQYISDIRNEADAICTYLYHRKCTYEQHLKYGEKITVYKQDPQIQLYIIYNWDVKNRAAYVTKILNNYDTY